MLIRSQNREVLINFDNSPAIGIMEVEGDAKITCSDTDETLDIGNYSTKRKAIKVLDMVQKAYVSSKIINGIIPEIGKALKEAPPTKENELLAEALGEELEKKMIFQMPQDSEVKVDG